MNRLRDEFGRTHRDLLEALRTQSPNTTGRVVAGVGASSPEVELRKQFIEYVWGDALTPIEREQLRTADQRALDRLALDKRQRVRLEGVENFAGADGDEFTLYTDGSDCGFDFAEGETYLVDTHMKVATGTSEGS